MIIKRSSLIKIFLLTLAILATSFLRPILFVSLPLFFIAHTFLFKTKYDKIVIYSIGLIIPIILFSSVYIGEWNLSNNILSIYFILPVVLIYFSKPKIADDKQISYFNYFIKYLTILLLCNNCLGFIQYALHPESDDSFIGFYGLHGLGLHTLSLINFIIAAYYFFAFQSKKEKNMYLMLFLFFMLSAIFCFYGLGLIVFVLAICIYNLSLKNFIKTILISALIVSILGYSLYLFRYKTFVYNYENIKKVELFFNENIDKKFVAQIPRKLILYKNYVEVYSKEVVLFLLGSGPGTFNSRTYFLLNGDYSKSKFLENIFGIHEPKYASQFVHTLWNSKNTSQKDYMDGTRNEPFSSVIAVLAEYGFIFVLVIFGFVYKRYIILIKQIKEADSKISLVFPYHNYFKFVSIFILLNLFTDNFLEYPEVILIYVIIFKLIELVVIKLVKDISIKIVSN